MLCTYSIQVQVGENNANSHTGRRETGHEELDQTRWGGRTFNNVFNFRSIGDYPGQVLLGLNGGDLVYEAAWVGTSQMSQPRVIAGTVFSVANEELRVESLQFCTKEGYRFQIACCWYSWALG